MIGMYDLIEIGDGVVFGSRSRFVPERCFRCFAHSYRRGANVADRCIIYGGVTLHPNFVRSGGVAPKTNDLKRLGVYALGQGRTCSHAQPG